jgi:hypothetical protein
VADDEFKRKRRKQRAQKLYHGWRHFNDDKLKALRWMPAIILSGWCKIKHGSEMFLPSTG